MIKKNSLPMTKIITYHHLLKYCQVLKFVKKITEQGLTCVLSTEIYKNWNIMYLIVVENEKRIWTECFLSDC